jgi:hypothetical protein
MIDKKVLLLIGVLVIVAVVVLAASMLSPASIRGGGSSFSALFDKMEINAGTEADLILPSTYLTGQVVTITDTVVAMEVIGSGTATKFYFDYVGTKWVNETSGTDFNVVQDVGKITVGHAQFSIQLSGDLHMSVHVGKSLTLQTTVTTQFGDQVLRHNWVPIL